MGYLTVPARPRFLTARELSDILCSDCRWHEHKGGCLAERYCHWSGAQVGPFLTGRGQAAPGEAPTASDDDPDTAACPLTLFKLYRCASDQVYGVLHQIDQRGLLLDLLLEYPLGENLALGQFYRERAEQELEEARGKGRNL